MTSRTLQWIDAGENFPCVDDAWGIKDPAPGLLVAGGALDIDSLIDAYSRGIFPWFSEGQPILWWSPDPRAVLKTQDFKLHRSLRKSLKNFLLDARCEIKFDSSFRQVIENCAYKSRLGQPGTWIVADMIDAYCELHKAGHAHSIETWINGELAGGLYCINLGRMVYGESMFSHQTDASKIALTALVAFCRVNHIPMIDCQQHTQHLESLGSTRISRVDFVKHLAQSVGESPPLWHFESVYWNEILKGTTTSAPRATP